MKNISIILVPIIVVATSYFVIKKIPSTITQSNSQQSINLSFTSYLNQIKGVKKLQLAEVTSNELIERTSEFSLFWNLLKLPDVVVQARIPTTYTYSINLEEPFKIEFQDSRVIVHAPALTPGPPAPDISGISYEVREKSFLRDSRAAIEELRKTITPLLHQRAKLNTPLALKSAKEELSSLVELWAKQNPQFKSISKNDIEVIFSNEQVFKP